VVALFANKDLDLAPFNLLGRLGWFLKLRRDSRVFFGKSCSLKIGGFKLTMLYDWSGISLIEAVLFLPHEKIGLVMMQRVREL
jgi:hypothetical protein